MTSVSYPAFLDLRGRHCVVVGGGRVATRKVESLLECGARVRVIAPLASPRVTALAAEGQLEWQPRAYRDGDLQDVWLCIAATDDRTVNARVVQEANHRGGLVTAVDATPGANVRSGAVLRKGDVTLAISSEGRSPAFARLLRERMEQVLEAESALFELMAELRPEALRAARPPGADTWSVAANGEVRDALARGDRAAARAALAAGLGILSPSDTNAALGCDGTEPTRLNGAK